MKVFVLLSSLIVLTLSQEPITPYRGPIGPPGPGPPCHPSLAVQKQMNVSFNACGGKCETSCKNIGDEVDPDEVADLKAFSCFPGCYCRDGYIKDKSERCVIQRPNTCDDDPCEDEPNTLWRRCALTAGPTCFKRNCKAADVMESRCVCKPGYSLNLDQECIRTNSAACRRLAKKRGCDQD